MDRKDFKLIKQEAIKFLNALHRITEPQRVIKGYKCDVRSFWGKNDLCFRQNLEQELEKFATEDLYEWKDAKNNGISIDKVP